MKTIFRKISGVRAREEELEDQEEEEFYTEDEELENEEVEEEEEQEDDRPAAKDDGWFDGDYEEGQLSIDVYQTPEALVVKSTIAGVKPEDIDISINNDMLTIRGKRELQEEINEGDYLYRECYWGSFSRSIILPVEIQQNKIDAFLENGVLTVVLPKEKISKQISIKVKER